LEARGALVKQIREGELIQKVIDDGNGYFHWLQKKSGLHGPLSSMLADTEFVSVDGIDDILMEKAKEETRRTYAEEIAEQEDLDDKEIDTLHKSIRGNCCLFEVIFCLASALNEMFEDIDACDGIEYFFQVLLKNARLDKYDEEDLDIHPEIVTKYWEERIRVILNREYTDTGDGGLFPIGVLESYSDRRRVSLWQQMNDYVDQHTNEDGEWVD
jgi:hypothetical protein